MSEGGSAGRRRPRWKTLQGGPRSHLRRSFLPFAPASIRSPTHPAGLSPCHPLPPSLTRSLARVHYARAILKTMRSHASVRSVCAHTEFLCMQVHPPDAHAQTHLRLTSQHMRTKLIHTPGPYIYTRALQISDIRLYTYQDQADTVGRPVVHPQCPYAGRSDIHTRAQTDALTHTA